MKNKLSFFHIFLALGVCLFIPFALFTSCNLLFSSWPLYGRNRLLLLIFSFLWGTVLFFLFSHIAKVENSFRKNEPFYLLFFCLFIFFLQLFSWRFLVHTPITDTEQIITSAKLLAETGTISGERYSRYLSWYPHNLGSVYLYAFLFKVSSLLGFTSSLFILVFFSAILLGFGLFFCARSAQMLAGYSGELRFLFLTAFTIPFYYCCSELYTDSISLPFAGIQIYFYLCLRKGIHTKRAFLFFSLFSLLGSFIRMTSLIICIACFLSLFFEKKFRTFFLLSVIVLSIFIPGQYIYRHKNEQLLGKEQLSNKTLPIWHYLLIGLPIHEDEGYGQYGDGSWLILSTSFDNPDERDTLLKSMVKDRIYYLRYPTRLLNMISRKNLSTFGDGTFHLNMLIQADEAAPDNPLKELIFVEGCFYPLYYHLMTALFLVEFIFASISCFDLLHRRYWIGSVLFIALVGAFIYLTIWETNARYFFPFQLLLLLSCSLFSPKKCDLLCPFKKHFLP